MSAEAALRATEVLMALAFLQQSAEHLVGPRAERWLFAARFLLSLLMLGGFWVAWALLALVGLALAMLHRFNGPYNGGSDRMGLLVLLCLTAAHWAPTPFWRDAALGYLALQTVLSYVISGQVKIVNPEWRSGRALVDVFRFSAYPVSRDLRALALRPQLLWAMGWAVMLFELAFPLAFFDQRLLIAALGMAALFHLANACLFGLNRFFWIWIAAYPSLLWLQARLV
ncbi:MAG: HTTM domain-containing protein [Pseudomonadota bacterium]